MADMVTFNGVPLATYGLPALMVLVLTMLTFNDTDTKETTAMVETAGKSILAPPTPFADVLSPTPSAPEEESDEEEEEENQEEEEQKEIKGGGPRRKRRTIRKKRK